MTNNDHKTEPFTNSYQHTQDFPEPAVKRIPADLLTAIDSGNKAFFYDLSAGFPKTYSTLTEKCPPLELLELIVKRRSLKGIEKEDRLYWYGFLSAGRVVRIDIPQFPLDSPIRSELQAEWLPCLPEPFGAFYKRMDGMTLIRQVAGLGFDLPNNVSDWRKITEYYEDNYLDKGAAAQIIDELGSGDLRVMFSARNGDFVVVDRAARQSKMFLVRKEALDLATEIEKPHTALDEYFANAILSPEPIIPFL